MNMRRILFALLTLILLAFPRIQAQNPQQERWTGEWGAFRFTPPDGKMAGYYTGLALSIQNCTQEHCELHFLVRSRGGYAKASGVFVPNGPWTAIAQLGDGRVPQCTLVLTLKEGETPVITAQKGNGDCSDFATPGVSFEHDYPLHARAWYIADDLPACYADSRPSLAALCSDPHLSDQERNWNLLVAEVSDLEAKIDAKAERARIFSTCDAEANTAACLAKALSEASERLMQKKRDWLASVTAPGEVVAARKAANAIAGDYRHRFASGDVQGDHFRATDKLDLRVNSDGSLHFSVYLEFFNGHQCNREGNATYRKTGFFTEVEPMMQAESAQQTLPCVFEILPKSDSVELRDPTGICRRSDCALRGGYNGATFLLRERTSAETKRSAKPTKTRQIGRRGGASGQ